MKNKRVVLITGASSGIGLAACEVFSGQGWYVIGAARRPVKNNKYIHRYCETDLSQPPDIERLVRSVRIKEKRLDALVNNAACQICKPLLETDIVQWRTVFKVNVEAPFLLSKGCYPFLKESQGCIVNVASVHAAGTSENISSYAASKGALVSLTRNMAIEFGKARIRVNVVLPGAVKTPMLEDGMRRVGIEGGSVKEQLERLGQKHVLGRVGTPEEIARVIYFLADSQQSSFITGQTLIVDGGALAKLSTE